MFKSKPNILTIFIFVIWIFVSGFFAYSIWMSRTNVSGVSQRTGEVVTSIFAIIILMFSVVGIYAIATFRSYSIINEELIISRPLIFSKNKISLADIAGFTEKDATISVSRGLSFEDISIGHKTVVRLKNGGQTVISSLEIWNYRLFIKKLQSIVRNKS